MTVINIKCFQKQFFVNTFYFGDGCIHFIPSSRFCPSGLIGKLSTKSGEEGRIGVTRSFLLISSLLAIFKIF